jgi:uncharacterized protein YndB with AHSA1/START domain
VIVAPERIVRTSNFEPVGPGQEVLESVMFEEMEGGRTKMTTRMLFLSTEDRDGMLQSGMEAGYAESLQRLDEVLNELKGVCLSPALWTVVAGLKVPP